MNFHPRIRRQAAATLAALGMTAGLLASGVLPASAATDITVRDARGDAHRASTSLESRSPTTGKRSE